MTTRELVDQLKGEIEVSEFKGQISLLVKKEQLKSILSFFKKNGYSMLTDLSAVDYLQPTVRTQVFYWLHNYEKRERVRINVWVEREGSLPSIVDLWEGADWYERELYDMFGIHFEGHPELKRILMPDNWVGHPMRKDYPLTEVPVEFKHGVKPKVPSEIIPHVKERRKT